MKTKIKYHGNEVRYFYDKRIPKLDSNHTCLAVISLDSGLKKDDNYYLQVFLKECKHNEKKVLKECKHNRKKVVRHINDSLRDFSSDDDESDEE